ncbi:hypothetical protein CgunFtcFv8_021380 [Champsocephalus gunnari]|uniref:Beta/gamma crystallin 'Greek key' domain-containing protein n=1 Tax=Champsocephalus gunnari TaxID=52237 RepID=A0AAN8I1J0_CHAGU|nr:hypothetical protein CgunFtcFv8_021380 [Champsocephalus gunnari]
MAQGNQGIMGKIVFYEERNFCGRQFECNQDCADLRCVLKQCSSIRVESGCFVIYDQPNFSGNQCCLKKGEYPDCQHRLCLLLSTHLNGCRGVQHAPVPEDRVRRSDDGPGGRLSQRP